MSVVSKILLGIGGAAVVATGLAGTANAQVVAATAGSCELYAREYAAVQAPRFAPIRWNKAYHFAYNQCLAGGPSFVSGSPYGYRYGYRGPVAALGTALAAPVYFGASVAGAALNAGASLAGAALSAPAAIASGTISVLTPTATEPVISPTAAPVVSKNYRGTYETVAAFQSPFTSTAALAVPAGSAMTGQFTPEWNAYCAAKYRSFNPDTGMYLAYSGVHRICR